MLCVIILISPALPCINTQHSSSHALLVWLVGGHRGNQSVAVTVVLHNSRSSIFPQHHLSRRCWVF